MRIADAVDAAVWAIEAEWLRTIRSIALGEGEGPEAVAARLGRPLQNTQETSVRDGVATIPITGPIFRYANLFTQVSGATSIELLARDLRTALDDGAVRAIILEINSPGGQVDGVNEFAAQVRAATGEKPVIAYVSGMATSAGYWIASAAGEVVVDATARLGSIGVVTTVMRKKGDPDAIEIVSSQSPNKRPDVTTSEGRAEIQGQVDAIADVFVAAVADYRGESVETVLKSFGAGGVRVGSAAIAAGMADRQGSLESMIAELAAGYQPKQRRKSKMAAEATTEKMISEKDAETLIAAARAEGVADALKAERERILGIDRIAIPGHDALIAECKANGTSVPDTAVKLTEAEKVGRERRLEALRREGKLSPPAPPAAPVPGDANQIDASLPLEERCKKQWESSADIRSEFTDLKAYIAYEKANAAGKVRVLRRSA